MTRLEAVDFVKHLLFEDAATTGLASSTQLVNTLDVANRTVWVKAADWQPSLFTSTGNDVTYPAATGYYALTTLDPYMIARVELKIGSVYRRLEPIDPQEIPDYSNTGYPMAYWLDGRDLKLVPSPTSDQTLRFVSLARPAALTGDSTVLLGGLLPEYHQAVCYEAAMMLAAKDEGGTQFKAYQSIRDELYKDMRRYLSKRNTYRPHGIREVAFE